MILGRRNGRCYFAGLFRLSGQWVFEEEAATNTTMLPAKECRPVPHNKLAVLRRTIGPDPYKRGAVQHKLPLRCN